MRKTIIIVAVLLLVSPFVVAHFLFVREIKKGGTTWVDTSSSSRYEYEITGVSFSGIKSFDYLPGGENTFDIGFGLIRLPLIRYTVKYSAVGGKCDPVFGPIVESNRFLSYFPIKVVSYY